ncbi:MAG: TetR/AcrR family transcriptional regulator [Alloprevotella sp.]|nr:TetR/AcrR family transcriptional regulator [Alloprevotella sp.]MBR1644044.1 TetR/AcrR family transcriptional regulator [Bacteroidales bacterium]MBR1653268.1 TetR/AcrR family transcriptional regulator [Alloprevotella sp.]
MQVQKDHTRKQILRAAEQAFLQRGFAKTSMRDIARLSGVGVGNLYNYFPKGKDDIFRQVVSPLMQKMERMIYQHHDEQYAERYIDYLVSGSKELLELQMHDYLTLMRHHRRLMELLFFKAQGSSLENFMDDYTDRCTEQVVRFMQRAGTLLPEAQITCSPFTYHLHTVWMFTMFCEIIKHRLPPREAERVVQDYITFEYSGWRAFIKR